jgi:adenine phosphoribosyltransferase
MKVFLTSTSDIKKKAVERVLGDFLKNNELVTFDSNQFMDDKYSSSANQPFGYNYTCECAEKRIKKVYEHMNIGNSDIIISIENGIKQVSKTNACEDFCVVQISTFNELRLITNRSVGIPIPFEYVLSAIKNHEKEYPPTDGIKYFWKNPTTRTLTMYGKGISVTAGEIIHLEHPDIPANNWMANKKFPNKYGNRVKQIMDPLQKGFDEFLTKHNLINNVLWFDDFPKKGVQFQDLSAIISNPDMFNTLVKFMAKKINSTFKKIKIHKVVGLDSRGFIYGPLVAYELESGFVMARKAGKLPNCVATVEYGTEYSTDSIEIMEGVINKGDNVLVVDDLIATGGSLDAAVRLVKQVGGNVIGCCVIVKVDPLFEMATSMENLRDIPVIVIL